MIYTALNRMTMSQLLKRRLLEGDIPISHEHNRVYVPYDSIALSRNHDYSMRADLMSGKAILATIDIPDVRNIMLNEYFVINRLEGRMEVQVEQERADFHRLKGW